jgi:SNF2 family DNA or RNA helicase
MKNTERQLFNLRRFVILAATVTGLGLPIAGLANHLHHMDQWYPSRDMQDDGAALRVVT